MVPACTALVLLAAAPAGMAASGAGSSISGRTLDPAGRLLAGVRVLLARRAAPAAPLRALSGADGRFLFRHLDQAEYLLVATRGGYLAGITRVVSVPASSVDLVLTPESNPLAGAMTWVLRLPERDILRVLRRGLPVPAGPAPSGATSLTTSIEQRFGMAQTATGGASTGALATHLGMQGGVAGGILWQSHADFREARLQGLESSALRDTEDLGLAGSAQVPLGRAGTLATSVRFSSRRLEVAGEDARGRALGLDTRSVLGAQGATRLDLHLNDVSARETGGIERLGRREIGLTLAREFSAGTGRRLTTSVSWRDFSTAGAGKRAVVGMESLATGATRLVPEGEWVSVGLHEILQPHQHLRLSYGMDLERREMQGGPQTFLAPGFEIDWQASAGTRLTAAARWLDADRAAAAGIRSPAPNVSLRLALFHAATPRLSVSVQACRENLAGRDPFDLERWPGAVRSTIWSDGTARADELRLAVQGGVGPFMARLGARYGEVEGHVATPDPFALTVAPLAPGRARYFGAEGAAVIPASGTEVSLAYGRVTAGPSGDYRVMGLGLRQGFSMPFDAPGSWRLLLDYEQVDGGRPFLLASLRTDSGSSSQRVGRVSGGVAVQF